MEWWEDFFDERYTDVWAAAGAFDATDTEVTGLVALLGLDARGPADILDIPCGFGRHSGPLAAMGHRVVAVDQSADQLRLARQRNPGPTYVRGDMRSPPQGPFDAVLNLFSSFGYSCDERTDLEILRAWLGVLRPGGAVVVEGNHRDRLARMWTAAPFEWSGGVMEHPSIDWVTGILSSRIVMADGSERAFRLRVYSVTELVGLLRRAGFVEIHAQAGFDDTGPPGPETRLLLSARAPG